MDVEFTGEDDAGEHDRGAGAAVDSEGADLFRGDFGDEEDGSDGAIAGDAEAGEEREALAGHFDDGEDADVGLAGADAFGAFGGEAVVELEGVTAGAVLETPDEGDCIEVGNDSDARVSGVRKHQVNPGDWNHFSVQGRACPG